MLAGGIGLLLAYSPHAPLTATATDALASCVAALGGVGVTRPEEAVRSLEQWLTSPALRFALAPVGLVLFIAALIPGRGGKGESEDETARGVQAALSAPVAEGGAADNRLAKKTERQAAALAKKGEPVAAAELLFSAGCLEKAAKYFIDAEEFVRAAEIRHDQNRFLESAEFYVKGERFDSAGRIFAQQEAFDRAGECYLEIGSTSVAAEMFEKAGDFRRAADCYRDSDFMRHAAAAYVKCKSWMKAAECLEKVFSEDSLKATSGGGADPKKIADLNKMIRQAGKLYQRAEAPDKALAILEKGGCFEEAAEIAMLLQQHAKAAELFQDAGNAQRASEALRALGEDEEAARILGNYHRDRGDNKTAAQLLEEAGDHLAAGDLYRSLEEYEPAGECFSRQGEHAQAAEMFQLVGDRKRAGEAFERAERYTEAAECFALLGLHEREAGLLVKAGEYLRAGEAYHREGIDDESISALQQVDPGCEGFSKASALLGDIFQSRGQLSLAIKKLKQAIGDRELDRENVPVYYSLATVCTSNGEVAEAADIYERILAFDYHYRDVEQRLLEVREILKSMPSVESTSQDSAASRGQSQGNPGVAGRYQIVGELGRGGMGIVYKAKDTVLDRIVAYKVLPDSFQENPQAVRNFLREAKSAAKLNHPGIVTVYDAGEQDGRYYIAMEFVDGTTLKEILRRRGVITPPGILHVLVQVCEALAYAHDQKVVHRDIKSANTMWTREKKTKIMDFGLAKVVEEVRNHITVISGTPYYMSPEQTLGKNVDHRTDIYSLGVTVFEMATGSVPFKEGNIPYHHVHTPSPDIREIRADIPETLASVVNRCLMKDPDQRYQSAREILDDLRSSLSQSATRTQR